MVDIFVSYNFTQGECDAILNAQPYYQCDQNAYLIYLASSQNTVENCLEACNTYNYTYAALTHGFITFTILNSV